MGFVGLGFGFLGLGFRVQGPALCVCTLSNFLAVCSLGNKEFWCCVGLQLQRLQTVLLENTAGLGSKAHAAALDYMLKSLKKALPDFEFHHKILDSSSFGVPQSRRRLYIVGVRRSALKRAWSWEVVEALSGRKVIEDVLDAEPAPSAKERRKREEALPAGRRKTLLAALEDIRSHGMNPYSKEFLIDIDTGRRESKLWNDVFARTLTRARGGSGGPWLSRLARRTTLAEMGRFQGLDTDAWNCEGISDAQLGKMQLG